MVMNVTSGLLINLLKKGHLGVLFLFTNYLKIKHYEDR